MDTKLRAFTGDIKKTALLKEIRRHRLADMLEQGTYGKVVNGKVKVCAVACSLRSIDIIEGNELQTEYSQHSRYETELGIPKILAHLEDKIFEGLPKNQALLWPERFTKAIKVGANLEMVVPKFFVWLLVDKKDGVIQYAKPDGKKAIKKVADLYKQKIAGKRVTEKQWRAAAAYAAAYAADADAAAYAAYAAAYAADAAAYAYAAYAADAAAADAAAYAAYAAAYAADADAADAAAAAAKPKHYKKMADKLIEIIKATK